MSSTIPPPPPGGGTTINFKNNCIICLQPEKPEKMLEILNRNPKNLRTFQPIVHYLTGTDPTYGRSQEECVNKDLPVMRNLPPLCAKCYEITSDIYRLHAELLELQLLIQQKTEGLREVVTGTRRRGRWRGRSPKNLFLERLKEAGLGDEQVDGMDSFLEKFHGRIQCQGGKKVIFPSHPPPNYLPLPKQPIQPLVLLQIPVQAQQQQSTTSTTTPTVVSTSTTAIPSTVSIPPPTPSKPGGVTIPRIIKTSSLQTAAQATPPPKPTIVPSTITPAVSRANVKAATCSVTSTVTATVTKSSNVVMIPGSSATIKFENEMEEDEQEAMEEMVIAPEVTIKEEGTDGSEVTSDGEDDDEEEDAVPPPKPFHEEVEEAESDREWEMGEGEEDSDSDFEFISASRNKKRRRGSQAESKNQAATGTTPSKISAGTGRRKQVLITRDQQQPPPPSDANGEIRLQRPEKVECELCDESMLPILLPSHLSGHLGSSGSTCTDNHCRCCRRTFLSRSKLLLHWHIHQCRNQLRRQNKTFIEDADVICPTCPSASKEAPSSKYNVFQYRHHVFSTHEKDASLPKCHGCPLCTSKFRTAAGLDYHLNVHCHKRRRYSSWHLDICPPGTTLASITPNNNGVTPTHVGERDLKRHMTTDTADEHRRHKCGYCSASFRQTGSLSYHLQRAHRKEIEK